MPQWLKNGSVDSTSLPGATISEKKRPGAGIFLAGGWTLT